MSYNFDEVIDRRSTDSIKWNLFDADVLPAWVADMDFRAPEPVVRALRERVDHGIFGYARESQELPELLVERMQRLYGWKITPEDIVFLPGVVVGFHLAAYSVAKAGEGVVMQTPVYHPFFRIAENGGMIQQEMELTHTPNGGYEVDLDAFRAAFDERSRMFLLCNPHNPIGRVFRRDELEKMAQVCLEKNVVICSDEIHCDFVYSGHKHLPIAALDDEVAQRTITLMAPSKTFNIAGLECSYAIVQNPELRNALQKARMGIVQSSNMIGYLAATAAYRDGQPWLDEILAYLQANRDALVDFVNREMPGVRVWKPEGTYLAWIDCRNAGIEGSPCEHFIKKARVGLNDGAVFGKGGEGFVRFNYGTPRALMMEELQRMKASLPGCRD